jgi:hypothetical protein
MTLIAALVLLVMAPLSIWAWRRKPGRAAQAEFLAMWHMGPWGKQIITDFYALELVLTLWMVSHAAGHGTWAVAIPCLVAMPVFGAMPAALYWLVSVA